jgi:hypothetical protein
MSQVLADLVRPSELLLVTDLAKIRYVFAVTDLDQLVRIPVEMLLPEPEPEPEEDPGEGDPGEGDPD